MTNEQHIFWKMVRNDTGTSNGDGGVFLRSSLDYLKAVTGADFAWATLKLFKLSVYIYNQGAGEVLQQFFGGGRVVKENNWHDGDYWMYYYDLPLPGEEGTK